jgi:L-fucose isomerase
MSLDTTWPDSVVNHALQIHRKAIDTFGKMGFEVAAKDDIARTDQQMRSQGEYLYAEHAEVLVLQVACWTYSNTAISAAVAANLPVIIWSDASPGSIGIVGASIVRGSLDEMGIKNTIVHGVADDKEFCKKLELLCRSYSAGIRLRGQTYGTGGMRSMGMYTAVVDPVDWRKKFGIDIDNWEQAVVVERAQNMPDDEARKFLGWMQKEFGKVQPKDEVMLAQIKLYLALREFSKENHYDFISVKCLPEMPAFFTTFCVAHALFNDTSDYFGEKESFVCSCEADANGALTMQLLKHLSGGPTMFADFLFFKSKENMATLCNCGSQPTEFAKTRKDVHWVTEGLVEFEWKIGGACPQYVAKPGRVTLARTGRINGKHIMLILGGTAVEKDREALREVNYQQPQAFINLDCQPENFIQELRSNHIHMIYGDYREHLKHLCGVLDIEPIMPK